MKSILKIIPLLSFLLPAQQAGATGTLAFPTAEGAGKYATGGRGGDVYHVTTLSSELVDGSFKKAIKNIPPEGRTIVFDVSGNIEVEPGTKLKIAGNNVTIAGQTAPGNGICIKGKLQIAGNNIIMRHVRIRPAGTSEADDGDALNLNGNNIILDHCSVSWSSDEVLSTEAADVYNITVQWTYIYEGLNISYHYENGELIDHSMGSLLTTIHDGAQLSFHHNMYAHNRTRNPKLTASAPGVSTFLDFRNNVIYDWGSKAGYSTDNTEWSTNMNYVGNYLVAGSSSQKPGEAFEGMSSTFSIYIDDNKIDADKDNIRNGQNTGWDMITGIYNKITMPFTFPDVATDTPDDAYTKVLAGGGAFPWNRDAADTRIANDVQTGGGSIIDWPADRGGHPALISQTRAAGWDTDKDGMPNSWETANGLNPNDASDRNRLTPGGYSYLEAYLNSLVGETIALSGETSLQSAQNMDMAFYPNPTKDILNIRCEKQLAAIDVFNLQGKQVLSCGSNKNTLDISSLNKGIYLVKCTTTDNEVAYRKVAKE